MIDLSKAPQAMFAQALEYNLERLASAPKAFKHFVSSLGHAFECDASWLVPAGNGDRREYLEGDEELCDRELVRAFAHERRPRVPRRVLLAPLRVHGRLLAVAGVARRRSEFRLGDGRFLNRLAAVLARDVGRREEERAGRVLDRIKQKIAEELRPQDLAYQILGGLNQLVRYDHSAAFLAHEGDLRPGRFRVEAEKIVWTKGKSGFIGHALDLPPERIAAWKASPEARAYLAEATGEHADRELHDALDYNRGEGIPAAASILCAPLFTDGELLGVLKIAGCTAGAFAEKDRRVVERFLPAAAVSLRNVQVKQSLEDQAMRAEVRAGLVTLARAVAHDVNNAIGGILPLAQQMREDLQEGRVDAEALEQDLEVIVRNAELCKRIFANMLRAGMERSGEGPIDLNRAIREMLPLLEAQLGARGLRVELELASTLPAVRVSRMHVERIVWNLVTNAVEAVGRGPGAIRIATRRLRDDVALTIEDRGPGMQPDVLAKVHEPFFSTKRGGTGLGLAICRSLVWQHGGRIHVDSAPGQGTRVEVRLRIDGATTGREESRR